MFRLSTLVFVMTLLAAPVAQAQGFPEGATTPTAADLRSRIQDKIFTVKLKDGSSWRVEFRGNYFYVDVSDGGKASGEWSTEDGAICSQIRGQNRYCGDSRIHNDRVFVKRASGEIIEYLPR